MNRLPCAHTARESRPGTVWGRTNRLATLGWTHAGAGAVCASHLAPYIANFDEKGFRLPPAIPTFANFQNLGGQKDM